MMMTIPPQLNAHTYEHTHTHTHIKKNTQLASVFITQQEILGADDGDTEITSHLHLSKPVEPVHLCRASLLHLSPPSSQSLPTGSVEQHKARYRRCVTSLQIVCFHMFSSIKDFCLIIPRGPRIFPACLFASYVSVFPSPPEG